MMDHPLIGGKFTVFVLCYGEYPELAKSCLGSILSTLPIERLDLRVGLNAVCDETRAYVKSLPTTKIYEDASNAGKYVIMRRMFHDPECPITTTHLVWFDDDARIVKGAIWQRLAEAIAVNHSYGARLYGLVMLQIRPAGLEKQHGGGARICLSGGGRKRRRTELAFTLR